MSFSNAGESASRELGQTGSLVQLVGLVPGKTIGAASHSLRARIMILDVARGCFGFGMSGLSFTAVGLSLVGFIVFDLL